MPQQNTNNKYKYFVITLIGLVIIGSGIVLTQNMGSYLQGFLNLETEIDTTSLGILPARQTSTGTSTTTTTAPLITVPPSTETAVTTQRIMPSQTIGTPTTPVITDYEAKIKELESKINALESEINGLRADSLRFANYFCAFYSASGGSKTQCDSVVSSIFK